MIRKSIASLFLSEKSLYEKLLLFIRNVFLLSFLSSSINVNSQTIFEYEREIYQKENYNFQEIEFENPDENIKLSGTLITPKTDFDKLIVIVAGSGKDTRYTHPKLTEKLLQNNIAVYRFDERGIGKSEGEYSQTVSTLLNDLNFCILQLRRIQITKNKKIGVAGHSLGGMASIGLVKSNTDIDFRIQMSTPVNTGQSFRYRIPQIEIFQDKDKSIEEIESLIDTFNYVISTTDSYKQIRKKCARISNKQNFPKIIINSYIKPQLVDMIKLDTEYFYEINDKPLLFIIGKDDELVDAKYGVEKLNEFDNKLITIKVLDKMDHYLTFNEEEWRDSNNSEIREIEDIAVNEIIKWIEKNN